MFYDKRYICQIERFLITIFIRNEFPWIVINYKWLHGPLVPIPSKDGDETVPLKALSNKVHTLIVIYLLIFNCGFLTTVHCAFLLQENN